MFGSVQRLVDGYLREHPLPGVGTHRVVTFDVTNRRIDGACYLFFGADGSSPVLVAKAARTHAGRRIFEIEHDNLVTLAERGMNRFRPTVPAALGTWREGELLVTLQTALQGVLLKNVPGAKLFSRDAIDRTIERVASWWLHFQDCFGVRRAKLEGELFDEHVAQPVRAFRNRYLLEPDEREFLDRWCEGPNALRDAELPLMARHGDFCAANMVLQDGGVGVFDWEFPLRHETPLFDLFFFFSSVRFPYAGHGGESSHSQSFAAVFWEESYFAAAMRGCLRRIAERFGVPAGALGDLFVLSAIQVANMKYEGLLAAHGLEELAGAEVADDDKRRRWSSFDRPDKDAPFAWIRGGSFENLRRIVRHGVPRL